MAPESGTLFDHLPVVPERVLRKYAVHQTLDSRFRAAARLLQALWREDKELAVGTFVRADGKIVRLGSRLAVKAGESGKNFLSPDIAAVAVREVVYREPGAMIDEDRLFTNLLSSMPLVFNLFAPLRLDLDMATAVVARLIPRFDGRVTQVLFEHSPSRGDPAFTEDYTAFDVLIRYESARGQRGFVAFEVKYSENGREPIKPPKPRYETLSRDVGLFADPDSDKLRTLPLQQLWREHCLAQAMIENGLYDEGTFVLVAPELNEPLQRMGRAYTRHLKTPDEHHVGFATVSLETVVEAIRTAGAEQHAAALHRRYCDFWLVDGEIELALDALRAGRKSKRKAAKGRRDQSPGSRSRHAPQDSARPGLELTRREPRLPRKPTHPFICAARRPPSHCGGARSRDNNPTGTMDKRIDIHQHVTDQIIAMLDTATDKVRLPWHRPGGNIMRPINIASSKRYRGVNILTLWATADAKGFVSGVWGTYRQWQTAGAQVRKGEKASFVVIYKEVDVASEEENGEPGRRLFARASAVFAAEQVDGRTDPLPNAPPPTGVTKIAHAEAFVAATGAVINHGGTRAFSRPSDDTIQLPPANAFIGTPTSSPTESYYAVLLHELTHWTAHAARCDRDLGRRFGDGGYAIEELVAELGAAFMCADLDLTPQPRSDHAHYLAHWLEILKADKRAIFTAASKASEAAGFLAEFSQCSHRESSILSLG